MMKEYTIEEIIQCIEENCIDIEKYDTFAEKAGAYQGTLNFVKHQLEEYEKGCEKIDS